MVLDMKMNLKKIITTDYQILNKLGMKQKQEEYLVQDQNNILNI